MENLPGLREQHVVSTQGLPGRERVAYWRRAVSADLLELNFHVPRDDEFEASMTATKLPSLSLLAIDSSPSTVERRSGRRTQAVDDTVLFNFVYSGQVVAEQDGRTAIVPAGDGVMCAGSRPYTFRLLEHTQLACVPLPRDAVARRVAALDRVTATNFSRISELGPLAHGYAAQLMRSLPALSAAGADVAGQHFVDLLIALMGQAASGAAGMTEQRSVLLIRVKDLIEQRLGDADLDAGQVAVAMRLSHRYVNRLFEAEGTSLARYLWQRRVERAASDLRSPALAGRGISQIALANGFTDMSHFSKAFRARFGESPRDYRRQAMRLPS